MKMSINVNEDVIGGGGFGGGIGGYGGGGIFLIAILLIFLVMGSGSLFGNKHHGDHYGDRHEGTADKLTWSRYANYEDPQIATVQREVADYAGQLSKQAAIDTGAIVHILDKQTCDIKMGEAEIIQNQQKLALEQERMYYQDKLCCLRDENIKLEGKLLQQETLNAINAGNCSINHRLTKIEDMAIKAPPFVPFGGWPVTNPCGTGPYGPFNGCTA